MATPATTLNWLTEENYRWEWDGREKMKSDEKLSESGAYSIECSRLKVRDAKKCKWG